MHTLSGGAVVIRGRCTPRGAPHSEAEHAIGSLIRRGREHGIDAPPLAAALAHPQVRNVRGAARGRSTP